ncbi:MAG: AAA family ATPase [Erysipelotrichales bacterium]|nr:AAA family ATPase [Erysipelotrichales bacterium]
MAMKRKALKKMLEWKKSENRKPLILEGARQVGKTWLMQEFGKNYFTDMLYINFDKDIKYKNFFEDTKHPSVIIERLSLTRGKKIEPNKTLIIFDEIQECPNALNSLKYFNEDAKEYYIISAGSLLGVYLSKGSAHPVGQVNIIDIKPMDFEEFLTATEPELLNIYEATSNDLKLLEAFHSRFLDVYKKYLLIGGMPEVVKSWVDSKDINDVEQKQQELVKIYERDFTKHYGKVDPERILMIYRNIPAQLAKENKKFVYGDIEKGARARSFETAIEWLVTSGLVNRLYRAKKNECPLKVFADLSAFKLYVFDTGLLKHIANVPNEMITLDNSFQFKGALAENFVLQQLKAIQFNNLKYFTFENRYEIDFLIQDQNGNIIPVEVKSSENVSSVSFNSYNKKFNPDLRIRYSALSYKKDENLINIPFYLIGKTIEIIKGEMK